MPRDTESIRHPFHINITETARWGGLGRDIWNIYPNSIGVPAGRNRGRFASKDALKKVQDRYWKKGLPMGMELELELPTSLRPVDCVCDNICIECADNNHSHCSEGRCEAYANEGYIYMRDYEPVKEVMDLINKRVIDGMKNFALRNGQDYYQWTPVLSAKGDGSLTNGVEFNFQPFTTNAFKRYAASTFQDIGYTKFQRMAPSAGIHIHIPKAAFSDVELYMWLLLMQACSHQPGTNGLSFLSTIGQREPNQYCGQTPMREAEKLYNAVQTRRWNGGKFSEVNFNGHGNTVELRVFASNQMPERLIKNMSFVEQSWRYVHLLMDFVNDEKYSQALQFLGDVNMFAGFLRNPNMKGYSEELATFIKRRWKAPREVNKLYTGADPALAYLITLNEHYQAWSGDSSVINNNTTTESTEVSV